MGIIGIVLSGILNWYSIYLQAEARRKYMKIQQQELEAEAHNNSLESENISPLEMSETSSIQSKTTNNSPLKGYGDLGQASFGSYGYVLANISTVLQQGGCAVGYFVYAKEYFPAWIGLIVLIPVCMFTNLRKISYISLFSIIMIIIALCLVVYTDIDRIESTPRDDIKYFDFAGFPLFFGVAIVIFEGN